MTNDVLGRLPQWASVDPITFGTFEAVGDGARRWRLQAVDEATAERRVGWWLAPVDDLDNLTWVSEPGNLYVAMDRAGMRIAASAVRADPDGARRQMGLAP